MVWSGEDRVWATYDAVVGSLVEHGELNFQEQMGLSCRGTGSLVGDAESKAADGPCRGSQSLFARHRPWTRRFVLSRIAQSQAGLLTPRWPGAIETLTAAVSCVTPTISIPVATRLARGALGVTISVQVSTRADERTVAPDRIAAFLIRAAALARKPIAISRTAEAGLDACSG